MLDRAIESLAKAEDAGVTAETIQFRLLIQLWRGSAMMATSEWAYADHEARRAYEDALGVVDQFGTVIPEMFTAYWGLWAYYVVRGDHDVSRGLSERCLAAAESLEGDEELLIARCTAGYQSLYDGDLSSSKRHLEAATALRVANVTSPLPQDPTVAAYVGLAVVQQMLGDFAAASSALDSAFERLDAVSEYRRAFTEAYLGCFAAWAHQLEGQFGLAADAAQRAKQIADQAGLVTWALAAEMHRAIAVGSEAIQSSAAARQQIVLDCVTTISQCLEEWEHLGHRLMAPYFAANGARLSLAAGERERAFDLVALASRRLDQTNEGLARSQLEELRLDLAGLESRP